jgi:predicted Rossmann fold nucleotide-binding protein DprA/Smf involved in DNA uptake
LSQQQRAWIEALIPELSAASIEVLGANHLTEIDHLGLFCSQQCPGRLVNATYDLCQRLRYAGQAVISGFHSPMEQECLRILLRGTQPITLCPARGLSEMRIPNTWRESVKNHRLGILSPFAPTVRRVTADLAWQRNQFVAALASQVFIAYAAPNSTSERFARALAAAGKPILTLDDPENALLLKLGAQPVSNEDVSPRQTLDDLPLFS